MYHLWGGNNVGQSHGYRQLSLVTDHGDQLYQLFKSVSQHRLGQSVELGPLLQDLSQHFHERSSGLQVRVVAQVCEQGGKWVSYLQEDWRTLVVWKFFALWWGLKYNEYKSYCIYWQQ